MARVEEIQNHTPADWPFKRGPKARVITTREVLERGAPIVTVTHFRDDLMMGFFPHMHSSKHEWDYMTFAHAYVLDRTLGEIGDLAPGWMAYRTKVGAPWFRHEYDKGDPSHSEGNHSGKLFWSRFDRGGWILRIHSAKRGGFEYAGSWGLYFAFGHPEIIVSGYSPSGAVQLINIIAGYVESGREFVPGEVVEEVAASIRCCFISVKVPTRIIPVAKGVYLLEERELTVPTYQLVWGDKKGRFPWDAGYDPGLLLPQNLLGSPPIDTVCRGTDPLTPGTSPKVDSN